MRKFVRDFVSRKGHLIFSATAISKITGLIVSVLVVRLIEVKEYGNITYAQTIIFFALPFIGFGLNHSLLRYGPLSKAMINKKNLFFYSLKFGVFFSILLVFLIYIFTPFIVSQTPGAQKYLLILGFGLITETIYNSFASYLRIIRLNKKFSYVNITRSILNLFLVGILTYILDGIGFVIALVITPLMIFLFSYRKSLITSLREIFWIKLDLKANKNLLQYGILVGLGSITTQLALMTDNLLIGNLFDSPEALATYRVGSLLPFNLLLIPIVFMTTDFVKISSEANNKNYLVQYYLNYLKLFIALTTILLLPFFLFAEDLIILLFGEEYLDSTRILKSLLIGTFGAFLLRIPLGNILNAVGRAKWNTYSSAIMLILNLIISYFLIQNYGIIGAAMGTNLLFWISGFVNLGLFYRHLMLIKE